MGEGGETDEATLEAYTGQFGLLLKEQGFEGVHVKLGKESLFGKKAFQLEQELGGKTLALGHDGENLWMGLESQGPGNPPSWDQNSEVKAGQEYDEVTMEPEGDKVRVKISAKHPAASLLAMAHALGYDTELRLAGQSSEFKIDKAPVVQRMEDGSLEVTAPLGASKLVFPKLPAKWNDAHWSYPGVQKLTINRPQEK